MKKMLSLVMSALMMVSVLCSCGQSSTPSTPQTNGSAASNPSAGNGADLSHASSAPDFIRLAASDAGGDYYAMGVPFCTLWEENLGIPATVQPGGGTANLKSVSGGDTEAGWTQSGTVVQARNAEGSFETAIDNVQMLFAVHPGTLHIATLVNSKINTIEDMKTCNIGLGPTGNTGNSLILSILKEEYGITEDDISAAGGTVNYLAYSEASDALKDGQIDAWVGLGPYPIYGISEAALNPGVRLIEIDSEKLDHYISVHTNWAKTVIPANIYGSFEQEYTTLATWNIIVVNESMDEETAYQMTKSVFENLETVWEVSGTAKNFLSLDNALQGSDVVTVHPGAVKYYKEIGLM